MPTIQDVIHTASESTNYDAADPLVIVVVDNARVALCKRFAALIDSRLGIKADYTKADEAVLTLVRTPSVLHALLVVDSYVLIKFVYPSIAFCLRSAKTCGIRRLQQAPSTLH